MYDINRLTGLGLLLQHMRPLQDCTILIPDGSLIKSRVLKGAEDVDPSRGTYWSLEETPHERYSRVCRPLIESDF